MNNGTFRSFTIAKGSYLGGPMPKELGQRIVFRIFLWLMWAINESRSSGQAAGQQLLVPLTETRTAGVAPSTDAILLYGEVDDSQAKFLSSRFKRENGLVLLQFRGLHA